MRKENMKSSRIESNPFHENKQLGQKKTVKTMAISKLIAMNFGRLVQIWLSVLSSLFARVSDMILKLIKNRQILSKVISERFCPFYSL